MIKIFKYLRSGEWAKIGLCVIFIAAQVWLDLKLPDYMSEITKLVRTPGSAMRDIWGAGGYMALCALGSLVGSVAVGFFAASVAASFARRLRGGLFYKVESFSMDDMNRFSTASLITRSTNDVNQIQMIVAMGMQVIIKAPIMAIWAISKIANKNPEWTLSTGVAVAVLVVSMIVIALAVLPRFKRIQNLTDELNRVTRENLTGLRVVRAYNAEEYEKQKFAKTNDELTKTHLFVVRAMAVVFPGINLILNGLSLCVYWIGAYLINQANMADKLTLFADMIVFSAYAMQVVMSFMMLIVVFVMFPRATVSARRIAQVLDTSPEIVDGEGEANSTCVGEVEFKNVSFKYEGAAEYVLRDISLKARRGETIAFIGSTGSGKSTLINLIPRFHDATEGQVLVDGVDIRKYTLRELRNKLGYISQRAVLFSGTVASNIAYGDNGEKAPGMDEVRRAAIVAQCDEFIEKMENGYEASIAQGGTNVSGGQKQRIAIARAVCRKPEIYIFDDAFSALDYRTDRALREALKKEAGDATKLIVAQRIGTIMDADKIVVLHEGQICGMGTHDELMKSCEVYREIAYSQFSREELAHA